MICRICGEDIDERGLDNVSPFAGYPICEDCIGDIFCENCGSLRSSITKLMYVEELNKILCKECLAKAAEKQGYINSAIVFYDHDYKEIGNDDDYTPVIEYLKDIYTIQEASE